MNKVLNFLLYLLICAGMPLFSYDYIWGGNLNLNGEAPEMQGTVFAASTTDSVNFWYKGKWSDQINLKLDTSLVFEQDYRYGVSFDTQELGYLENEYNIYPDIKEFNLCGSPGDYYYRAGRQIMADPGKLIVSHPIDGLMAGIQRQGTSLDIQAGYTGLVYQNASNLSLSINDFAGDHTGDLAAPRLLEKLTWSLPGLFQQELSFSLIAQQDLHKSGDLVENSEKMDSQYMELVMRGYLLPTLAYSVTGVGEIGSYGDTSLTAGAGRFELTLLPLNGKSILGLDIIYSTGDSWDRVDYYASGIDEDVDKLNQFTPISSVSGQGYVEVFELGNLTALGVFASISPSDSFSAELRGTTFLRTTPGPVASTLVLNDGNDDSFIGQEGLLSLLFSPASDVNIALRTGVLYKGDIITIAEDLEKYFPVLMRAGLDFSLSF